MKLVHIALAHCNIDNRREPSAELCRINALIDGGVFQNIGIEGGEEPQRMGWVIDGRLVEQKKVLVVGAAAHVEVRRSLVHSLDAGHQLEGFQQVGLAQSRCHHCYAPRLQLGNAGGAHLAGVLLACNHHLANLVPSFAQLNIEAHIFFNINIFADIVISQIRNHNRVAAFG